MTQAGAADGLLSAFFGPASLILRVYYLREQTNTDMSTYHRNAGKAWSSQEVKQLGQLAKGNTPTRVIGLKLGRPVAGVYAKASEEGISLKPTNQSPRG